MGYVRGVEMSRLLLALLVCFSVRAHGAEYSSVQFPTLAQPGQIGPMPVITAVLYKPSGSGPFAAVVVLHHCGGIDPDLHVWARRLADQGYVSIVPDSFGPRGAGRVCTSGEVSTAQRVPDAYAAANYLRTLPWVRGDRIGLIGFSHGGGTIAQLASSQPLAAPFRAAVAFYPDCRVAATTINLPTLILIGAKDDWTPAAPCTAWASRVGDPNKLNVVVYPDAYHKFDGTHTVDVPGGHGAMHHLQPDAAATADANAKAEAFLARMLK
jgi:dienelactone hydrolase